MARSHGSALPSPKASGKSGAKGSTTTTTTTQKGKEDQSKLIVPSKLMTSVFRDRTNLNLESPSATEKIDGEKKPVATKTRMRNPRNQQDDGDLGQKTALRSRLRGQTDDKTSADPKKITRKELEDENKQNESPEEQKDDDLNVEKVPTRRLRTRAGDDKSAKAKNIQKNNDDEDFNHQKASNERSDDKNASSNEQIVDDSKQKKVPKRRLQAKTAGKTLVKAKKIVDDKKNEKSDDDKATDEEVESENESNESSNKQNNDVSHQNVTKRHLRTRTDAKKSVKAKNVRKADNGRDLNRPKATSKGSDNENDSSNEQNDDFNKEKAPKRRLRSNTDGKKIVKGKNVPKVDDDNDDENDTFTEQSDEDSSQEKNTKRRLRAKTVKKNDDDKLKKDLDPKTSKSSKKVAESDDDNSSEHKVMKMRPRVVINRNLTTKKQTVKDDSAIEDNEAESSSEQHDGSKLDKNKKTKTKTSGGKKDEDESSDESEMLIQKRMTRKRQKVDEPLEKIEKSVTRSRSQQPTSQLAKRSRRSLSTPNSVGSSPVKSSGKDSSPEKQSNLNGKRNGKKVIEPSSSNSSSKMRQTTLKESFSKQAKRILRPKKTIDEEIEKNKKKVPVYKTQQPDDDNDFDDDFDVEKIYEFKFDENDSQERLKKKSQKQRVMRRPKIKRIRKVSEAINEDKLKNIGNLIGAEMITEITNKKIPSGDKVEPKKNLKQTTTQLKPQTAKENLEKNENPTPAVQFENVDNDLSVVNSPQLENNQNKITVVADVHIKNFEPEKKTNKPKLISEKLLSNGQKIKLFPKSPIKKMIDNSLLQSLSPIPKEINDEENIEAINSPWRASPIKKTFSCVKNVFQSTPQSEVKGSSILVRRPNIEKLGRTDANLKTKYIEPIVESPQKPLENTSKSPRKFGTNISNINTSNSDTSLPSFNGSPSKLGLFLNRSNNSPMNISHSPKVFRCEVSHITPVKKQSADVAGYSKAVSATDFEEIIEDKENSRPNTESPKKSPVKSARTPKKSPLKDFSKVTRRLEDKLSKEVDNLQPEPSTQKNPVQEPSKLKQTNLNKFFNIPEKPESTKITTSNGLFEDVETVITAKKKKPSKKVSNKFDLSHAFGFDDELDSIQEDSNLSKAVNENDPNVEPSKKVSKRLDINRAFGFDEDVDAVKENSITLYRGDTNENDPNGKEQVATAKIPVKDMISISVEEDGDKQKSADGNSKQIHLHSENLQHAKEFEDTFDVEEPNDKSEMVEFVPLFVDLEPVHFKQPPRYSYKRKRHNSFNTSDEREEIISDDEEIHKKKRKKVAKVDREQQKQLKKWAKNINQTFEEIDNFDLYVE